MDLHYHEERKKCKFLFLLMNIFTVYTTAIHAVFSILNAQEQHDFRISTPPTTGNTNSVSSIRPRTQPYK